ncbi:hypothetical protein H310_03016 [Aphanomyces invadans]|uniref:Transmembrane protein n=1 Tax=Aphanomyces invadans TaxID=157072 RepID=A0A024UKV3_9STRA|nr:hypothetical protein H310_03016 [Aphanomyces invadans]ETW06894.1 hypothetical protein H310_03016 [Aphanomyces invadans]RHY26234.1 hypothetical protein DYB32_007794 [Aphanomyces invadans]|eukprot:XP_008864969.1 hypothetical protein H310_03016 [Aphanomyces invadans]
MDPKTTLNIEERAAAESMMLAHEEHSRMLAFRSVGFVLCVLVGLLVLITWQRRRISKAASHKHAVAMRLAHFKRVSYVLNKHREIEMANVEMAHLMHDDDEELKDDEERGMM